ncbi:DNA repair protein RecN [Sporolactobacillus vineae]|uniref:DNA repair protein RecN n=1 Tax=Sporolactobacillus vineae TaxID=444463 RepID=UPI0002897376|nr:DNA repair protein RecN [Sporolactobacillus vineae]
MLAELQIKNFALIDRLNLSFEKGMSVFTGETGAGKSIIIDAIGLLAGGRASTEYVRHGTEKAEIEGQFDIDGNSKAFQVMDDQGIDHDDQTVIISREISAKGKSVCRVNGKLVTLAVLQKIGRKLIDIHGQHEHQLLLDPDQHLPLIDLFGGDKLAVLKETYRRQYQKTAEIAAQLAKFNKSEKLAAQRIDLLKYQIREISEAHLQEGEDETLEDEKNRLTHFQKVFQALKTAYEALDGENMGLDWIRKASTSLDSVQDMGKEIGTFSESVANCRYTLEDQAASLRDYLEQMAYHPERLDEIETRLDRISLLKRKYGASITEILSYLDKIGREYDDLTHRDQKMDELYAAFQEHLVKLKQAALSVSQIRQKTVVQLNKSVSSELKDLYMNHARFEARLNRNENLSTFENYHPDGIDEAEFFITTNPGEPMRPLAKIASGGELSRIMLALKSNFRRVMGVSSIIFDEVDTGVSGRVAQAMAEKIFSLSKSSQVFCITHLPQVAAIADHHFYISKRVTPEHRTLTSVKKLNEEDKINEIGRMISGTQMTELTRRHAHELRVMAEKVK